MNADQRDFRCGFTVGFMAVKVYVVQGVIADIKSPITPRS